MSVLLLLAAVAAQEPRFDRIFDGKTLDGWDGNPEAWTVEDGAIRSTGQDGKKNCLTWRGGTPGDFELRLQSMFIKGN